MERRRGFRRGVPSHRPEGGGAGRRLPYLGGKEYWVTQKLPQIYTAKYAKLQYRFAVTSGSPSNSIHFGFTSFAM